MFYVYAYIDPFGRQPFYIGKGKGRRAYKHLQPDHLKKKDFFHNKLRGMLSKDIKPEIVILYDNLSEQKAFEIEEIFIATYGRRDLGTGCLCNHTKGGDGVSGIIRSKETKRKMSEARKGRKFSQKTRQKLSDALKGNKRAKGIKRSKETKRKMSEALKGRKCTDKDLQRLREFNIKRRQPIESYNLETEETIEQFESLLAAKQAGFNFSSVQRTVKGKLKKHRGLGWRYTKV